MFLKQFSKSPHIKFFHESKQNFHSFSSKWVELPEHARKSYSENQIRILSYNILAESNIRTDMYPECTSYDLDWRRRQHIIIQYLNKSKFKFYRNIADIKPDIACLQEFQPQGSEEFVEILKSQSYDVTFQVFCAKTKTGHKIEGEACFWNKEKYELLHEFKIDMQLDSRIEELSFMNRETIAHIVVLRNKNVNQTLIIGNTHVLYHMKRGEFKLGQTMILMKGIESVRKMCESWNYPEINCFICGDFNAIPNSMTYNLLTEKTIDLTQIPIVHISNQVTAVMLMDYFQSKDWHHFREITKKYDGKQSGKTGLGAMNPKHIWYLKSLVLQVERDEIVIRLAPRPKEKMFLIELDHKGGTVFESSYAYVYRNFFKHAEDDHTSLVNRMISRIKENVRDFNPEELTFETSITHMTHDFRANVDYIWYDVRNSLRPYRILETIDYHTFKHHSGFPNNLYPSDHVPIATDFA